MINTYPRNPKFSEIDQRIFRIAQIDSEDHRTRPLKPETVLKRSFAHRSTTEFLQSIPHAWQCVQSKNSDRIDFYLAVDLLTTEQMFTASQIFDIDTEWEMLQIDIVNEEDILSLSNYSRSDIVTECLHREYQGRRDLVEVVNTGFFYDKHDTVMGVMAICKIKNWELSNDLNRRILRHNNHSGYCEY